jgi:hypothetical protein
MSTSNQELSNNNNEHPICYPICYNCKQSIFELQKIQKQGKFSQFSEIKDVQCKECSKVFCSSCLFDRDACDECLPDETKGSLKLKKQQKLKIRNCYCCQKKKKLSRECERCKSRYCKKCKPQNNECSQCYSIFLKQAFQPHKYLTQKWEETTLLPNAFEEYFEALENLKEKQNRIDDGEDVEDNSNSGDDSFSSSSDEPSDIDEEDEDDESDNEEVTNDDERKGLAELYAEQARRQLAYNDFSKSQKERKTKFKKPQETLELKSNQLKKTHESKKN